MIMCGKFTMLRCSFVKLFMTSTSSLQLATARRKLVQKCLQKNTNSILGKSQLPKGTRTTARDYSTVVADRRPTDNQCVAVHVDDQSGILNLQFSETSKARYPFVWLRDNCHCSECHEKSSVHRLLLLEKLDLNVYPSQTDVSGDSVIIHWSDQHRSEYPIKWLQDFKFPTSTDPIEGLNVTCWDSKMTNDKIKRFSFKDVMSEESVLYDWLACLHTDGFSIMTNLADDDKNLLRLGERVAHPRITCYGEDFVVKSNPEPTNLAYTGYRLCLHSDLPFYNYEPGIQILHCITKSEHGGSNEFADAFSVAYELQKKDPETFEILSTVDISFVDQGSDVISKTPYVLSHWKPIVRLDKKGQIKQVNFNNHVRGVQMSVEPEDVKKVYKALATFNSALYRKDNFISITLQEGEAACFNNTRILHGRSAFTVPKGCTNPRHLQGIYLDWDEVYARMRSIAKKEQHKQNEIVS